MPIGMRIRIIMRQIIPLSMRLLFEERSTIDTYCLEILADEAAIPTWIYDIDAPNLPVKVIPPAMLCKYLLTGEVSYVSRLLS
ncbi:hypothetical protein QNH14_12215 [Apirhabdus apintestini]|nr:hypothetical protein QNH14_12215 [Enterobacteriaceae bacterium CA-0114]